MSFCELSFDPGQVNAAMVMVEYISTPGNDDHRDTQETNMFTLLQKEHPHKEFLEYLDKNPSLQEHLCDAVLQGMHRLSNRIIKQAKVSQLNVQEITMHPKKTQLKLKRQEKERIKTALKEAKNEDNYKVSP